MKMFLTHYISFVYAIAWKCSMFGGNTERAFYLFRHVGNQKGGAPEKSKPTRRRAEGHSEKGTI